MARFNIALLLDADLHGILAAFADEHFRGVHDGYILGEKALAHVTLCQFRADSSDCARKAFESWDRKASTDLCLGRFQLRKGQEEHEGMVWAEFLVEHDGCLPGLQQHCFAHLAGLGLEVLTPIDTYAPHITLARIPDAGATGFLLRDPPFHRTFTCSPAVGLSTDNGVFVEKL